MPEEPIIGGMEPRQESGLEQAMTAGRIDWSNVTTPEEAIRVVQREFGGTILSTELRGNEFERAIKDALIGTPFIILEYGFTASDQYGQGKEFSWVRAMRMDNGERIAFADGSTGIYAQLRDLADKTDQYGGVMCRNGLRVSRYDKTLDDGTVIQDAETYYIDS